MLFATRSSELQLHDQAKSACFISRLLSVTLAQTLGKAKKKKWIASYWCCLICMIHSTLSCDCPWQQPTHFQSKSPWLSKPVQMMSLQHWYTSLPLALPCLETFTNHNMCRLPILRPGNSKHPGESFTASCGSLELAWRIPVHHVRCFWPD